MDDLKIRMFFFLIDNNIPDIFLARSFTWLVTIMAAISWFLIEESPLNGAVLTIATFFC
jgi:hypothetical protein